MAHDEHDITRYGEHAAPHGDQHGHGGTGKYWAVFLALCILTGASFFTYSAAWPFQDTPSVGWTFMMAVSCTKAMLVILFFMHLLWEANWKYVLTIPAAMMSLFLVCMLVPDVGRRVNRYSDIRWKFAPTPQVTHIGDHDASATSTDQDDGGDGHH